jgi:hypothetical protein
MKRYREGNAYLQNAERYWQGMALELQYIVGAKSRATNVREALSASRVSSDECCLTDNPLRN